MDLHIASFYNAKMALVNLDDSSIETIALPAELLDEHFGGVQISRELCRRYVGDDPLVFGTGPLTGSFAPASCLMTASFSSPDREITHVPFMLNTGPQLKFSGIDFLVIIGRAATPVILELMDGTIRLTPGDDLRGDLSTRENTLMSRGKNCPEAILITGEAADKGCAHACLSTGLWGSLDKSSLGSRIAGKNIRAIAIRAAGGMTFPAESIERSGTMIMELRNMYQKRQFIVQEKMGAGESAEKLIRKHFKKSHTCYHCPLACMSYLEFKHPGSINGSGRKQKQGVFLLDHAGFALLSNKRPADAVMLLKHCIEKGIDPAAAAVGLTPEDSFDAAITKIEGLSSPGEHTPNTADTAAGSEHHPLFGAGIPRIQPKQALDEYNTWEKKVALGMTLGICPIMLLCYSHIKAQDLLAFISTDTEALKAGQEKLSHATQNILSPG